MFDSEAGLIDKADASVLAAESEEIAAMMAGLIKYFKAKET